MYIGVTNDLKRRLFEHKNKIYPGFTNKYNLNKIVYYELFFDINDAMRREKELKKWRREKKNNLIELINPNWNDLSQELFD
jgi:putative endonuclease